MEIKITSQQMLKILYILSWIIFIGLCIEAGGIIFNAFYSLVINPAGAHFFWQQVDFSGLYKFDRGHFLAEVSLMGIVALMKAVMFYLIVKILHDKKLNLSQPFNAATQRFISNLSYLSAGISLFSYWGVRYTRWLAKKGIEMPDVQSLDLSGADVWLFMSITLFIIAQIFKRGIEIQTENELTV